MALGERTVALLGAGASVEAGVPVSTTMTSRLTSQLSSGQGHSDEVFALNVAIGLMTAHDTTRGGSAFAGIDVERLFSAVQMLGDRDNLEITPFVTAWHEGLNGMRSSGRFGASGLIDEISKSLASRGAAMTFARKFEAAVLEITGGGYDATTFRSLEKVMVDQLYNLLAIQPGASDYLAPLLNLGGIEPARVATLNYDRGVDQMARRWGYSATSGLDGWDGAFRWNWGTPADVRVLKLHGSIDWRREDEAYGVNHGALAAPSRYSEVDADGESVDVGRMVDLGVVFGQRGKVRADGPFLAMLTEFERWLHDSTHLVVIGYSFRDEHINSLIRRRLLAPEPFRLTLVDPALDDALEHWRHRDRYSPFLLELFRAFIDDRNAGSESRVRDPHQIVATTAGDGLLRVLGGPPDQRS